METTEIELPGGIRLEGSWRRDAVIRPLSGRDEAFLREQASLSPAARTTAILARCLYRLGPLPAVTCDVVRSLSLGDREALLLHLRRLTLGEAISCVLDCPACADKLDLDLRISELLLPPYGHAAEQHEISFQAADGCYRVRFRLPNGGDQEQAAAMAAEPEKAAELLLKRCVAEIISERTGQPVEYSPSFIVQSLAERMAELDPQAEIVLELVCPACGASFRTLLDTADYFYREICGGEEELYHDVHLLALHYHWSEAQVLRLSRRKRLRYVELLTGAAGEGRIQ